MNAEKEITDKIFFKNPRTGETQTVGSNLNIIFGVFSVMCGIPLFIRRLNSWGYVMLALQSVYMLLYPQFREGDYCSIFFLLFVEIIISLYLGIKGNRLLTIYYFENGWIMENPHNEMVRNTFKKWKLEPEVIPRKGVK
ncbi:MAG TPA: hypothetical protein PLK90_08360 [Clostridiales bacterium]|nr:hypothetical protein [Clostridiales bacterium]HQP70394.1 hypothetical protein [Clostridiales bacterium]